MLSHSNALLCWALVFMVVSGECLGQVAVSVGQTATLPCHVEIQGNIQVSWRDKDMNTLTWNTEVLTEDRRFSVQRRYQNDWDLQINNVKITDAGNYSCCIVVATGQCNTHKIVALVIQFPPMITNISSDVILGTGDTARLFCQAKGVPQPTVKWLLRNKELVTGGEYVITNANRADSGKYECVANNGVLPAAARSVQVTVNFKPQVTIPYREIRQTLDSDTLLECRVRSNPTGDIYWERDGQKLETVPDRYRVFTSKGSDDFDTLISLVIYKLRSEDFTWYTCVAKNPFGSAIDTTVVSVWHNGTLRMLSTPKDVVAQTGQNVVIDCTVEGMTKDDQLTWWRHESSSGSYIQIFDSLTNGGRWARNGSRVMDKYSIVGQFNLMLKSVVVEDGGSYSCHILGLGNYTAVLTVFDPDNSVGSECSPYSAGTPTSITIVIVVSLVAVFIIVLVVVILLIARYYRRRLAKSRKYEKPVTVKTERYSSIYPDS